MGRGFEPLIQYFIVSTRKEKNCNKVFYGQEHPSGELTTTECGVTYQLLAVMSKVV